MVLGMTWDETQIHLYCVDQECSYCTWELVFNQSKMVHGPSWEVSKKEIECERISWKVGN